MPSDIMDQRHMSSFYRPSVPASFFSDEIRFPSERLVGFWKTGSVPDHHCLETMSFMPGGRVVPSSLLEKFCPVGSKFADGLELQHSYLFKDPKRNISFEHHLADTERTANCWRAPGQDIASLSRFCGQPVLQSVEAKKGLTNEGHFENDLFSSSLSDMLNQKLRLSSNDVYVGQSAETAETNFPDNEAFKSLEEIEAQTIGDLLPDDDDLLSGALQGLGYVAQTNRMDVEDDLFCSVGGLELDSDVHFGSKKVPDSFGGDFSGRNWRLDNFSSSELSCGERPTRTLFVRNVNGIEDSELRVLFEQFGDIQAFYTACRHLGFIMVSYYDIRAAQHAIAVLQTKSIRTQKLDIHFCLPLDNPLEKNVKLGALMVTNLDSSISNDSILHLFGVYGQIKEICELPHKKHHKFVEFYDARDAEAALSALNMLDIAGKRIKIEPCCLGDANLGSSIQQLSMDLEEEQSNGCRGESYPTKLSSESFGVLHDGAMHGMLSAFGMPNGSFMETRFYASAPHSLSSPTGLAIVGSQRNQSSDVDLSNSLGQRIDGFGSMPIFSEVHNGTINGLSFNSPSAKSSKANVSSLLANGFDNRNIGRFGSIGRSSHFSEHKEATYYVSGNGSSAPHIWNNSSSYHHPTSLAWHNMSPFVNNIPAQTAQMDGLDRVPSHILPLHNHVGSAPIVDPSLFEGRNAYTGDVAAFHPASFGNMGYSSCSPVHASHNIFPHAVGNCRDPSVASAGVGISLPQQRCHIFPGRNSADSMSVSRDVAGNRIRSRRNDSSASQEENKKQYELDIDQIIRGEDSRTTLMLKNIPNKYTSKMLLATIDEQHKGTYDFIYLPIDFKNKCNVGYAFINMTDPQHIIPFFQTFDGKKWEKFNSEKVASLAYGRIQGKAALIAHFQNSSLMNEDKRCRPIIFHSNGPKAGDQEPFPLGLNIRPRRSRANTENHQGSPSGSTSEEESANMIGSPSVSH